MAGQTTLTSSTGDVKLTDPANDFKCQVTVSGKDVYLVNANDLKLDVKATGDYASAASAAKTGGTSTGLSVDLVNLPPISASGLVTVMLPRGTATTGTGFAFPLPAQLAEASSNNTVHATLPNGLPLPN